MRASLFLLLSVALPIGAARAIEEVTVKRDGQEQQVEGKAVIEAEDGGILLLANDGVLWTLPPEEMAGRTSNDKPFKPLARDELGAELLEKLPAGFDVFKTRHYVICFNTSRDYAKWCGSLFERLYAGFTNYWSRQGFQLHEPEFPLVAVVFNSRQAYQEHARPELQAGIDTIIGYYSLQTNRMTMYDLTGLQALRRPRERRGDSEQQINDLLSQPRAERNVSTIIHEATHQIAFNCGLQTRYADIPLWVSEGIAVFFETPDLSSARGWRGIGGVNETRFVDFRRYLAARPNNSLETLIVDDRRFRNAREATDAYAEAWALNYFLLKLRTKQYVVYLKKLAEKPPLVIDGPERRLAEFEEAFGDIDKLDAELVRLMERI